jgi:hypothetical protein
MLSWSTRRMSSPRRRRRSSTRRRHRTLAEPPAGTFKRRPTTLARPSPERAGSADPFARSNPLRRSRTSLRRAARGRAVLFRPGEPLQAPRTARGTICSPTSTRIERLRRSGQRPAAATRTRSSHPSSRVLPRLGFISMKATRPPLRASSARRPGARALRECHTPRVHRAGSPTSWPAPWWPHR